MGWTWNEEIDDNVIKIRMPTYYAMTHNGITCEWDFERRCWGEPFALIPNQEGEK